MTFLRNVGLAMLPTFAAAIVSAACFQIVAWTGSYLWLFAGMYAPLLIGLTIAALVRPVLLPDGTKYVALYFIGQFVAVLACVATLAPPEK